MPDALRLKVDRGPHVWHLVGSAAIVIVSVWMAIDPQTNTLFRSEALVRVAGVVGIAAGTYAAGLALRMLTVEPGLELSRESIVVRSGPPPVRTVDWSDIEGFSYGRGHVVMHLNSGSKVRMTAYLEGIDRKGAGEHLSQKLESYAAMVAEP